MLTFCCARLAGSGPLSGRARTASDTLRRLADRQRQLASVAAWSRTVTGPAQRPGPPNSGFRSSAERGEPIGAEACWLEEKAKRLEHLLDVLARQNGAAPVAIDIRTVRGALAWPVHGKILESFGKQLNAKFSTVTFNNGLKIAAAPGIEVHSVFAGTVLFSQWFKGYGNLVILDHGNRVFSLYGNLKSPVVAVGDRVNAGQAIAGVGESEDAPGFSTSKSGRTTNRRPAEMGAVASSTI
jgi:murein DD-endopeptidase MepM/ murein hydrolase activator NlpD